MSAVRDNRLLLGGIEAEALAREFGTPLYVYEEEVIRRQARLLRESFAEVAPEFHFALKANFNPALLAILRDEGYGIDAVSPFEVQLALAVGFAPRQVLFTGNNTDERDLRYCLEQGVPVNVGSLVELERYGRLNPGGAVSIRINPDVGAGHHRHVITGGPHSKFGIYFTERERVLTLLAEHRLTLSGVHSHIGTGILQTALMLEAMEIILRTARAFRDLQFVDFGGGFGVPYRPEQAPLPLAELGREMARRFKSFCADYGRPLRMKLEPGRFVVAQSGTLLARVTNISSTPAHRFVGTDSGFNHLIRPVLYGAYHEVVNASAVEGTLENVAVAGNICESGDVFTHADDGIADRPLSAPQVGHLLAFRDAGAYGMVLSSQYNMRPRPAEVLVAGGRARLIRRRETFADLVRNFPDLDAL
ncbi:MAG: diaminopimelate decarboxylase [Candidatus Lambdaproteobacteria bacterium]|nr:diaminopimelate decarboxylase [Candidatus Lambdaproteobacteria bacterium]